MYDGIWDLNFSEEATGWLIPGCNHQYERTNNKIWKCLMMSLFGFVGVPFIWMMDDLLFAVFGMIFRGELRFAISSPWCFYEFCRFDWNTEMVDMSLLVVGVLTFRFTCTGYWACMTSSKAGTFFGVVTKFVTRATFSLCFLELNCLFFSSVFFQIFFFHFPITFP